MDGFLTILKVESEIRQGCPFSPLAFVLSIELLAIKIKDCKDPPGIHLEQVLKIALYADDITLFWGNEHEMSHALSIVKSFSCVEK